MYKNATKCNETIGKWCKTKHGASKIIDTFETYQKSLTGRVNPRSKCEINTTLSLGSGPGTVSPAGSRNDTLAGTRRVVVIQDMSAGVTSDPSQPEHP
jgi:hypothetical protein